MAAAYLPVTHSGGDLWTCEVRPDGHCWVLDVDATGHGAAAAVRRLGKLLAQHGNHEVASRRDALMNAIVAMRGRAEPDDDLTLLVVGRV